MLRQYTLLKKIISALIDTFENEHYTNEATLKNHFFHYLKLRNSNYNIIVEENLNNHANINGRADYYLDDKTKSYRNDVVIEFKINCYDDKLIKHDLLKLDRIKKLNKYIATIFINVFTEELNFKQYLKLTPLFFSTKSYVVTICPKAKSFFFRNEIMEIVQYKLQNILFIVNNARFIETHLIPLKFPVIRLPNKGGMTKYINLYLPNRESYSKNKYIQYCEPK